MFSQGVAFLTLFIFFTSTDAFSQGGGGERLSVFSHVNDDRKLRQKDPFQQPIKGLLANVFCHPRHRVARFFHRKVQKFFPSYMMTTG
ncbi:hypothetical protein M431DRAFT_492217 [Trichoderma harzianum CBS 226.95]|uniref:Secreted protein n=1 Tax=Trichoderma harzianum CBS 226.95 TaxID=983964 RepID=A0A2T4ALP0_TRIHA|nr:hypothetical protein M431DRAFT_492217 [Trichoderma harzianum CBS 226.95]PTB57979.1 hypothetical protein M431DRAFT_492217 [Trichoderma harzianum CBS 226.95]